MYVLYRYASVTTSFLSLVYIAVQCETRSHSHCALSCWTAAYLWMWLRELFKIPPPSILSCELSAGPVERDSVPFWIFLLSSYLPLFLFSSFSLPLHLSFFIFCIFAAHNSPNFLSFLFPSTSILSLLFLPSSSFCCHGVSYTVQYSSHSDSSRVQLFVQIMIECFDLSDKQLKWKQSVLFWASYCTPLESEWLEYCTL